MNIRKFVGASSRDALRLVRETLGSDAVVLSNRSVPDGTVEIMALADRDLEALTPQERRTDEGAASPSMPARAPINLGRAHSNPYASGSPDVFSSVFGASPVVGGENPDAGYGSQGDAYPDADEMEGQTAAAVNPEVVLSSVVPPVTPVVPDRVVPQAGGAPGGELARASQVAANTSPAPRTMGESNPWLIDHARQIVDRQSRERESAIHGEAATRRMSERPIVETPEWAREAAQSAARRTAYGQSPANPLEAAESAARVSEAISQSVERVVSETVMGELASIRGMMEEQFAGLVWGERQRRSPARVELTRHLFAAGFSAQLVQLLVENLPLEITGMDQSMQWLQTTLERNLPVLENEEQMMERGGVFALTGPTGVGKTTTTAKLAARCVMRFGANRVALLTTDSYRIGGHEQLRIFGRILGVSVHAVKDSADLQLALSELRNKHIVLIDTIGMSQRDLQVSEQIGMLCRAGQPVQRLLLLNSTSHGDTLNEVVQSYQRSEMDSPLAGCILTKIDEATNLGGALDTVIRYKLPVHYVSTGQKVPENLYVATKKFLIKSAFCVPRGHSPFVPQDDDGPGLLSALAARSTSDLHEVRFG